MTLQKRCSYAVNLNYCFNLSIIKPIHIPTLSKRLTRKSRSVNRLGYISSEHFHGFQEKIAKLINFIFDI